MPFFKPQGLWYGIDGDWERWMRDEDWGHHEYRYEYELTIIGANVRAISSVRELDAFHREYRADSGSTRRRYLDWPRAMRDYDGIEIAPYLWERRLEGESSAWYYAWDCASGCLWRPRDSQITLVTDAWKLPAESRYENAMFSEEKK